MSEHEPQSLPEEFKKYINAIAEKALRSRNDLALSDAEVRMIERYFGKIPGQNMKGLPIYKRRKNKDITTVIVQRWDDNVVRATCLINKRYL